jgi:hypothetical protein
MQKIDQMKQEISSYQHPPPNLKKSQGSPKAMASKVTPAKKGIYESLLK